MSLRSCLEVPRLVLGTASLALRSIPDLLGARWGLPRAPQIAGGLQGQWGRLSPGPAVPHGGHSGAGVSQRELVPADAVGCSEPSRPAPRLGAG